MNATVFAHRRGAPLEDPFRTFSLVLPDVLSPHDVAVAVVRAVGEIGSDFSGPVELPRQVTFAPAPGHEGHPEQQIGDLAVDRPGVGTVVVRGVTLDAAALEGLGVPMAVAARNVEPVEIDAGTAALIAVRLLARSLGATVDVVPSGRGQRLRAQRGDQVLTSDLIAPRAGALAGLGLSLE